MPTRSSRPASHACRSAPYSTCRARNGRLQPTATASNLATGSSGRHRRGCRYHRRAVHRRAGHPADHAYLPYRRRRSAADITQGLPRVEELFEARQPEEGCYARRDRRHGLHRGDQAHAPSRPSTLSIRRPAICVSYQLRLPSPGIRVTDGQQYRRRAIQLTEGSLNPHDMLRILERRGRSGLRDQGSSEGLPSCRALTSTISTSRSSFAR